MRNFAHIPPFPLASQPPAPSLSIVTHDFTNLPPLTPDQADVVGAMIASPDAIPDIAEALDIPLGRLFDILASPNVQAHLASAQRALDRRVRLRLAEAAHKAVDTLERIADSPTPNAAPAGMPHDPTAWLTERRRAATTILRAHTAPRRRRAKPGPTRLDVTRINDLLNGLESRTIQEPGRAAAKAPQPGSSPDVASATTPVQRRSPIRSNDDPTADASETRRNSTNRRDAKAAPSSGNPAHKISSEPQLARPP